MRNRRRGVILLLVLVTVSLLALAIGYFAQLMLNEHRAAQTSSRQSQARTFAESGAEVARQFLDRLPQDQQTAGGLYDNSQRFYNQVVADDDSARDRGRFSIVAPKLDDGTATTITGVRYGLLDESAKINLATILSYDNSSGSSSTTTSSDGDDAADNTNAHAMLMGLPGMTDEVADAILDWIDADDTPREQGAESEYYTGLQPAYAPRNAPPTSIEELLLVKGVTPELLFGYDAVKMGYSSSDSVSGVVSGIGTDGSMDHGWAAYLTMWSAESTLKPSDGTPKINVNQSDLSSLYSELNSVFDQKQAEFIVAYRLGGGTADGSGNLDASKLDGASGRNQIGNMLDLVGAAAIRLQPSSGNASGAGELVTLANPFTSDTAAMNEYLPLLFDNCTTISGAAIPGRININQASRIVLLSIPNMTSDMVDQIISNRTPDPASSTAQADRTCPAWPLIEGIMPLATMKLILPYITAGGSVYRAQIIGHFDKGTPSTRLEVMIDATQHPAQVLFWKDMPNDFRFAGEASGGTANEH
jgi:DNA uptake protein ComE-like DNA-binding protein